MTQFSIATKKKRNSTPHYANLQFLDHQIELYRTNSRTTVLSIIEMSKTVALMHQKFRASQLTNGDMNYFCESVQLNRNSSQFRKFVCIGNNADRFFEYIEKLPNSISVLYEITTLCAETFQSLIEQDLIKPNLSLAQLKKLVLKSPTPKFVSPSSEQLVIEFDLDELTQHTKMMLVDFYLKFRKRIDVTVNIECDPGFRDYLVQKENEDIIELV